MCGRFVLKASTDELMDRFGITEVTNQVQIGYNLAPTMSLPVIVEADGDRRELRFMDWGFPIPGRDLLINAKAETAAELRTWKKPIRESRCIVPASGYYEWRGVKGSKQPYYIHLANDELIGFAGLWRASKNEDGKPVSQFAILTTTPAPAIADLHHRMPVILHREDEERWLARDVIEPDAVLPLLVPYDGAIEAYPVSSRVGSTKNNDPELIEPIANQQGF